MSKRDSIQYSLDWTTVIYFMTLVFMGWISIYGASFDFDYEGSVLSFDQRTGKQFVWILTAFALGGMILLIDHRIFNYFAWFIYGGVILILMFTLVAPASIVPNIKGSHSWIVLGPVSFQPAELAKIATALALAKFMSRYNYRIKKWGDLTPLALIILLPFSLIILQRETGSALVFVAFLFMLYREGMKGIVLLLVALSIIIFVVVIRFSVFTIWDGQATMGIMLAMALMLMIQLIYAYFVNKHVKETGWFLAGLAVIALITGLLSIWIKLDINTIAIITTIISGIYWGFIEMMRRYKKYILMAFITFGAVGLSFAADYLFNQVLEPHQQIRIKVLLNMEDDLTGAGYNVNQSKIAIGSGGFLGKGFLNGTQTKLKYVPEQDTDFIFCTVGEEHGFWGSTLVLIIYWLLLMRILTIAERQREDFHRIYAYCVASILFFHLMVNVGMVLGLMPVIGIPLPFFSYGGSSLWGFTILLFILLRLDASRLERSR